MNNLDESRIEQPSLVQALDKYREMEKVLEEEYDSLQDVIIQSSNEWQGAASKALISEMEYFLNEGDYNTAYENVKTMRLCMEDALEQVNALLAISEEFPKQLQRSTYIEPMRTVMGDNTVRNGGVVYLDYGKARLIPDLCEQVYEAAEYLGNVLKQHMEVCSGIMDGIPTYINRVDEAVKKVKRIENYKFSFQKYVQDVMALENDVAVRLAGMKTAETIIGENAEIERTLDREVGEKTATEYGKEILDNYLIQLGYDSSIERKIIIYFIEQEYTHYLAMLYGTKYNSTSAYEEVKAQISLVCARYKEEISFSYIKDFYKYNQDIFNYQLYVEYLDYLKSEQYICPAEYDDKLAMLETNNTIEDFTGFLEERENLFKELAVKGRCDSSGKELETWSKKEIMIALQIEYELRDYEYKEEFIYGLIGHMKAEGDFGTLEAIELDETALSYYKHIAECVNYEEKYDPYNLSEVNLLQMCEDMLFCEHKDHFWGVGIIQWSDVRAESLLAFYLQEAGYGQIQEYEDINKILQKARIDYSENNTEVYLTPEQIQNAELKYLLYELTVSQKSVYNDYLKRELSGDMKTDIINASDYLFESYIKPRTNTKPLREAQSIWWYEARN